MNKLPAKDKARITEAVGAVAEQYGPVLEALGQVRKAKESEIVRGYCISCGKNMAEGAHESAAQRRRAGYKKGYHMGRQQVLDDVLAIVEDERRSKGFECSDFYDTCNYTNLKCRVEALRDR